MARGSSGGGGMSEATYLALSAMKTGRLLLEIQLKRIRAAEKHLRAIKNALDALEDLAEQEVES